MLGTIVLIMMLKIFNFYLVLLSASAIKLLENYVGPVPT